MYMFILTRFESLGRILKKPDLSFCLNFLEYLLCMIIQVTNKARRWYNIRVLKSSCSKWGTSRVKEEINTQEANGSDWRQRGCFPQAARRKEETTNEQTQSFGGREKCKGAEKSINKKNSFWIYCINFKINKLPIPKTYSTTVQHLSKDLVHPSIQICWCATSDRSSLRYNLSLLIWGHFYSFTRINNLWIVY